MQDKITDDGSNESNRYQLTPRLDTSRGFRDVDDPAIHACSGAQGSLLDQCRQRFADGACKCCCELKRAYHVCPACGHYDDRVVVAATNEIDLDEDYAA